MKELGNNKILGTEIGSTAFGNTYVLDSQQSARYGYLRNGLRIFYGFARRNALVEPDLMPDSCLLKSLFGR